MKLKSDDYGLFAETNKELIGKRARFKNNLRGYISSCWNKTGVIVDSELTPYLYLKFDIPLKAGYKDSMVTECLVIQENSFDLLSE